MALNLQWCIVFKHVDSFAPKTVQNLVLRVSPSESAESQCKREEKRKKGERREKESEGRERREERRKKREKKKDKKHRDRDIEIETYIYMYVCMYVCMCMYIYICGPYRPTPLHLGTYWLQVWVQGRVGSRKPSPGLGSGFGVSKTNYLYSSNKRGEI